MVVQRGRSGAGQRCGDGAGRRGYEVEYEVVVPVGTKCVLACLLAYVDEHVPSMAFFVRSRGHRCVGVTACTQKKRAWLGFMCMYVCVQTQLWLALQLITRHSQLLITQHLFCPCSTLSCAYCQSGSLRRNRRRALSDVLLLKSPFFCCFVLQRTSLTGLRSPANGQIQTVLAHSLDLSLWG